MEVNGQLHAPGCFILRKRALGTHWVRGWVGPRACLDAVVKRKIPCPSWDRNPRSSSPQPSKLLAKHPTELKALEYKRAVDFSGGTWVNTEGTKVRLISGKHVTSETYVMAAGQRLWTQHFRNEGRCNLSTLSDGRKETQHTNQLSKHSPPTFNSLLRVRITHTRTIYTFWFLFFQFT
jgi:hypothetical protein